MNREVSTIAGKKREKEEDVFMVSFASLMILLLTFMILMVTLARFKEPRFRKAIGSVKGAFSVLPHTGGNNLADNGTVGFLPVEMLARATIEESEEEKAYRSAIQQIEHKAKMPELAGLMIEETEKGVAIRISDVLMFERGSGDLKAEILPILDLVAEAINLRPGKVSVVGNTCNLPVSTRHFPSNWELSIVRAVNVVHHLESKGVGPESLLAYGLADQYPLASNENEEGRRQNRRVEIYVVHNRATGVRDVHLRNSNDETIPSTNN